jgi:hypothetical protein
MIRSRKRRARPLRIATWILMVLTVSSSLSAGLLQGTHSASASSATNSSQRMQSGVHEPAQTAISPSPDQSTSLGGSIMFVPPVPIVGQSPSLVGGPSPLQAIGPCSGSSKTHYWAGEIYSSGLPTINASGIQTTVVTPSGNAESGYGYFQLLSVFDSGGHYDQLGFANNCGKWVQLYSFTSLTSVSGYSCIVEGGIYYCGATGMATFAEGTPYTYEITVPSSGNVEFQIIQ